MCSAELAEWLSLIVFESDRCLRDVLYELQSMTPEEREELTELRPFDLEHIEVELIGLIEIHGDSVTADDLKTLEPIAA